jgi:ribokinase
MYDVITVGSATMDAFAMTEMAEAISIKNPQEEEIFISYPAGSKIIINDLKFFTGGGGTNTAVAYSRFGLKTAYLGNLGKDENGNLIKKILKKEKVDFIGTSTKEQTGYSVVLDSMETERTILVYKGSNDNLKFSKIQKNKLKTKWFHLASMVGESFKTVEKLAEYAEKKDIKILFNPSNYLAEKGYDYLYSILKRTEILLLNEEESRLLVKEDNILDRLRILVSFGPKYVIITNGSEDIHAIYDGHYYIVTPNKVKDIKETTGAGDAFASTFLAAMIKGKNIETSLKLALINSQSVIKSLGAKNKLLSSREAMKIMKKTKIKVIKKKVK